MRRQFSNWTVALGTAAVVAGVAFLTRPAAQTQTQGNYRAPRTPDGKPDINGIWQAVGTANWDIEDHMAAPPPVAAMGAMGAVPPGIGVVEGGAIPYQPAALAKKKENFAKRMTADPWALAVGDPELKCYLPGVPRATYLPYPFQILQGKDNITIAYEFSAATRFINMGEPVEAPTEAWMGWSNGRWEGETLVVDVTAFTDRTWFDRAGNHHSDALHVVERYTPTTPYHLMYEATIEDPKTFTRPWKISMPLYRRMERNAQVLDFKCVEFAEPLILAPLVKK
jgi:hypothetical protein